MTDTQKESTVYFIQYDIVSTDDKGELLTVCFHEPGRMGFDTIDQAQHIIGELKKADAALGQPDHNTYEIRPVCVSELFMHTTVDVDEDELFGFLKPDEEKKTEEGGKGGAGAN